MCSWPAVARNNKKVDRNVHTSKKVFGRRCDGAGYGGGAGSGGGKHTFPSKSKKVARVARRQQKRRKEERKEEKLWATAAGKCNLHPELQDAEARCEEN